jgi:hypothetical protein
MTRRLLRALVVALVLNLVLWAFLAHLTPAFSGRRLDRYFVCY